ncbi:hypothetical protein ACFPMF_15340 [Larkinella bovis]|uniref:Uncharacterized protein n=1 Tax=Larkinella bovis TaxID=683041 RepID=A0ABW0IB31_9BACT
MDSSSDGVLLLTLKLFVKMLTGQNYTREGASTTQTPHFEPSVQNQAEPSTQQDERREHSLGEPGIAHPRRYIATEAARPDKGLALKARLEKIHRHFLTSELMMLGSEAERWHYRNLFGAFEHVIDQAIKQQLPPENHLDCKPNKFAKEIAEWEGKILKLADELFAKCDAGAWIESLNDVLQGWIDQVDFKASNRYDNATALNITELVTFLAKLNDAVQIRDTFLDKSDRGAGYQAEGIQPSNTVLVPPPPAIAPPVNSGLRSSLSERIGELQAERQGLITDFLDTDSAGGWIQTLRDVIGRWVFGSEDDTEPYRMNTTYRMIYLMTFVAQLGETEQAIKQLAERMEGGQNNG